MAVVSVTADNDRVDDAEDITGVTSRGGGAGASAEAPLAYQGSLAWNRKITSGTGAGFEYSPTADTPNTARNMTTTGRRHWMVKHSVSDFPGLVSADGLRVYIGDGTNEYGFVTAGTTAVKSAYSEYLLRTATIIMPVSPNVIGYRDSSHSGTGVSLTAVDLFGIEAAFTTSSAKSENLALDAIDIGAGLDLIGGDGVSADGVWADFVDADEGTPANRWGYANSIYGTSGVLFFFGRMRIGSSASATEFSDTTAICLWPDGLYEAGFSRVELDVQNASTVITEGSTHTSLGTTATEDTRLDYAVVGTSGTANISGVKNNLRNVTLTSAAVVSGADIQCADLTQGSADISDSVIRCNSASGVAVCNDITDTNLSNVTWQQTGSGHAIEITAPGTYSFSSLFFDGFGADGSNAAAVYNNSGGAVTINVTGGGDTPTVRNGTSATTTINNAVTITLDGLIAGSRVYIANTTDSVVLFNEVEATTTFTDTVNYTGDKSLLIRVRNASSTPKYKPYQATGTLTSNGFSLTVNQVLDE